MNEPNKTYQTKCMRIGAGLGGGLALLVFGGWMGDQFYDFAVGNASLDGLLPFLIFFTTPIVLAALSGALLGYLGARLEHARFIRLFVTSLGLYLACSLGTAISMAVTVSITDGPNPDANIVVETLGLAMLGAIFLSAVSIPALLLLVFLLERWTRRPA